ncbi:MAG: urease accessory protein UreD [Candidatus Competibacter sp.]
MISSAASPDGWQAWLGLGLHRRNTRTVLEQCAHRGPLRVQRPFYPEGESVCHIAILHPPGGVVGGDQLRIEVTLATAADALVTTPAAGKFYRSAGPIADQVQTLRVAPGATLEWLPQENILYNGARVRALTRIDLEGDARFLGWETFCLGRPAAGEVFIAGEYRQDFQIWRDGEPLYLERGRYAGGDPVMGAPWGLRGQPVCATLVCAGSPPDGVRLIRAGWEKLQPIGNGELATVSQLNGMLICRYLGPSTARAKQFFVSAWGLLRPALFGRPPCPSRFWNT